MLNETILFETISNEIEHEIVFCPVNKKYFATVYSSGAKTIKTFKSEKGARKWLNR